MFSITKVHEKLQISQNPQNYFTAQFIMDYYYLLFIIPLISYLGCRQVSCSQTVEDSCAAVGQKTCFHHFYYLEIHWPEYKTVDFSGNSFL